jgi:ATP-dependent RNA helicase DDX41
MSEVQHQEVRDKHHIIAEGEDIPPPIDNFTVSTSVVPSNRD